jgi:uncharacterized protein YbcV (DUF1398 family)
MFTVAQIKQAHSQVKSGADFPAYIREIKALGVTHYESFVTDGHIDYHGANDHLTKVPPKYAPLAVADSLDKDQLKADVKAHQQGKTDYPTFCKACAKSGIEKWVVNVAKMTCTYHDKAGNEILVEEIPQEVNQ